MDEKETGIALLAFEPEEMYALKARLDKALVDKYDPYDENLIIKPYQLRKHVFDTNEGVRIIISRDRKDRGGPFLYHVSVSLVMREDDRKSGQKLMDECREALRGGMPAIDVTYSIALLTCKNLGVTPLRFLGAAEYALHFVWERQ